MRSVQFIFGVHNHQPVGNFDFIFEDAYQKSYLPFLTTLEDYPNLSMAFHFSGCLTEWLEENHPEFLDRFARLVDRGNIEVLSAGFYEPVLAVIPDHDKQGQIRKMNDYIEKRFKYKPRGLWLTERVWEPQLAKPISEAGMHYIAVDDFHFLTAGKQLAELTGFFNTDEQDKTLGVYPISQRLRYAMPFQEPKAALKILKDYATEDGRNVVVMADDGEKFGVWPGTNKRCYGKENWLRQFFDLLESNRDWITTTTFKDHYRDHSPLGKVYIPTASYFEMSEWTLPAEMGRSFSDLIHEHEEARTIENVRPFLRGGMWRNFQSLYSESDWMQKRVTDLSFRIHSFNGINIQPDPILEDIRDDLWRSQCNCAYWHGVFGGLYLPHLRHAIYTHLLQAENGFIQLGGKEDASQDIDGDGVREYRVRTGALQMIATETGGCIRELDILKKNFNIVNSIRRYSESYHTRIPDLDPSTAAQGSIHDITIAKEPNLDRLLQKDLWPRYTIMDHFLPGSTEITAMKRKVPERGNFIDSRFRTTGEHPLEFTAVGRAFGEDFQMRKLLVLENNSLDVAIKIDHVGSKPVSGLYGCEMNFSLLGGHSPDRYYEINGQKPTRSKCLEGTGTEKGIRSIAVVTEWEGFRARVQFPAPTHVWRYPVITVSMSEAGFEKIYQSSVIIPYWKCRLDPGQSLKVQFKLIIEEF